MNNSFNQSLNLWIGRHLVCDWVELTQACLQSTSQVFKLFATALTLTNLLQAKFLKVRLLLAVKDFSTAISETGYLLKEDENNLEALLLRGHAYYYLADHDVALRFVWRHLSSGKGTCVFLFILATEIVNLCWLLALICPINYSSFVNIFSVN